MLKSGCKKISKKGKDNKRKERKSEKKLNSLEECFCLKYLAKANIRVILDNSEGWNFRAPKESQRLDPPINSPEKITIISKIIEKNREYKHIFPGRNN
ncbi:MAG: hypothetical protein DRG25_03590 [Deltaproteobacteria bacterium]|nr:MAG: hypothetical protein DRG25_03590 [Deltaproteobacteria bacterium]